ncbi:hypothetical protein ACI798_10305 [Geodermatophilus sp. SYSU D01045]
MTVRRLALAPLLLLALAGCTADGDDATPAGSPAPAAATVPPAAGADVADALAALPAGAASGTVDVRYQGLGRLAGPLTGACTHPEAGRTAVTGSVDTATLEVAAGPDGVVLTVLDGDVEQRTPLSEGEYRVDGPRLVVTTTLLGQDTGVGEVDLDLRCGG